MSRIFLWRLTEATGRFLLLLFPGGIVCQPSSSGSTWAHQADLWPLLCGQSKRCVWSSPVTSERRCFDANVARWILKPWWSSLGGKIRRLHPGQELLVWLSGTKWSPLLPVFWHLWKWADLNPSSTLNIKTNKCGKIEPLDFHISRRGEPRTMLCLKQRLHLEATAQGTGWGNAKGRH